MQELRLASTAARGPLSEALLARLLSPPQAAPELSALARAAVQVPGCSVTDEDVQLSLTLLYELHYRGISGVDGYWEWHPDLLGASAALESGFERDLRALAEARVPADPVAPEHVPGILTAMISADDGPSLSQHVARHASREELAEL